ncbi:MAG: FtsX-like permease family protein [Bacteroidales bacterium]|nr:FtsX-like permease family protein [Candidatus Minthousia equi]
MNKFSKTKASPILNILGMTIAFTAFYVIMSQVMYDVTFNQSIKDADKKYMICSRFQDGWISRSPIQASIKTADAMPGAKVGYFNLMELGNKVYGGKDGTDLYHFNSHYFTHQAAEVLGLEFISGKYPEADGDVAISDKVAETMSVASGDMIYVFDTDEQKKVAVTVTGIFKSYPANSDLGECDVLINEEKEILATTDGNFNYNGVVSLENADDTEKFLYILRKNVYESWKNLVEKYNQQHDTNYGEDFIQQRMQEFKLVPLTDLHFSDVQDDVKRRASRSTVFEMIGIALLIVIIAFINFVNFFVALVPEKMRSVNIRKVFGASRTSLIWKFVKEALIYVSVAIILACILILAISKSSINELTDGSIGFQQNLLAFVVLILVSVVFAVLSALFPALYVTRINAAVGVKSGFSRSRAGVVLRKVLITFQLATAVVMMIISAVFFMQYRHMTSQQLGFDKENLFVAGIPYYKPEIKSRVEGIAGVKAVTASSNQVTGNAGMTHEIVKDGISLTLKVRRVLPNYLDVVGIPLISGEVFTDSNVGSLIVEDAMKDFGDDQKIQEIISTANDYKLTGFCVNTNSKPATDKTENGIEAYTNVGNDYQYLWCLIVRTEPNVDPKTISSQLKQAIVDVYQLDEEMNAWTVDTEMTERYARFMRQSQIFGLFSLIAIIIALMGVFGIVLFETEHRRHETAVRKVLGADELGIIGLFCRQYIWIILTACLISTPIAHIVTEQWLQQFSSQIDVPFWVYLAAFAIVAVLTFAVIALRIAKAAKENPVNNLKSE